MLTDGLNFEDSTVVDNDITQNGQVVMEKNTEIYNITNHTNNEINIAEVKEAEKIMPNPKVAEITIAPPIAEGKKRPAHIIQPKKGEFIF